MFPAGFFMPSEALTQFLRLSGDSRVCYNSVTICEWRNSGVFYVTARERRICVSTSLFHINYIFDP
jgi:hypothetical protein